MKTFQSIMWRPWWPSVLLAAVVTLSVAPASGEVQDTTRLSGLVRQDCGSCHGLTLRGGLGKPLTPEHLGKWDREQLVSIILDGVPGTPMPPWRPLITEGEAGWIADRLQQGNLP